MKKRLIVLIAVVLTTFAHVPAFVGAQAPAGGSVVRLDPAADAVIPANAVIEKIKDGFGFVEAPLWIRQGGGGYWIFSDVTANVLDKLTTDGTLSIYLNHADWSDSSVARPDKVRFGANGLALDRQGRLVYCAEADRAIVRVEKDGKRTVLADRYDGKRLNSPNDLVYKSDGALYFTDPSGGGRFTGWDLKKELAYQGVYLLKDGKLQLLIQDFPRPNGIELSPDEKYLYVNDSNSKVIKRYAIQRDDTLSGGELFVDMSAEKGNGNPDGMKADVKGNLFSIGVGGIWVISPAGKHLATIVPPGNGPGIGFGDPDRKSFYMSGGTSLYRIRLNTSGR